MKEQTHDSKQPVTIESLQGVAFLSGACASPDNIYLAFVQSGKNILLNEQEDRISLLETDTRQEIKSWPGWSPKWSPVSNELAYMAPYDERNFLWKYSVERDEHMPLTEVVESSYFMGHLSNKNFEWAPDGARIAFVGAESLTPMVDSNPSVVVIDRLLYKTKGGRGRPAIADHSLSHIYIIEASGGTPVLITPGAFNEHSLCWSPDGNRIAFISNRTANPDNNQLHDLYSIEISSGTVTRHSHEIGTAYQPAWSPDGAQIALLATTGRVGTNDSPAEDTHIYLVSITEGVANKLTGAIDRRIEQYSWHPTSSQLYFLAGDQGTTGIYTVQSKSGKIKKVIGEFCHILEFSLSNNGEKIYYSHADPTHPSEIFCYDQSTYALTHFTEMNAAFVETNILQAAETFWFDAFDGLKVQGWLVKPVHFDPEKGHPLVLVIHGGPHNMFGYDFEDRMQWLASRGYGVLYINPRGSSGYGQQFSSGTVLNWGGGDYQDLMWGLDAAIAANSWIDPLRLGVTGQSYGGYMTNWIITQTDRFKAAIADGSISNLISFAGTSLYHSLIESEFNGSAYNNFSLLWQWSPLRGVANVRTPTLLLHGETDNEVPLSQAEEMYIALKKNGVECQFVQYKGEGHGWRPDLKPANRNDALMRTVDWLDKYLMV